MLWEKKDQSTTLKKKISDLQILRDRIEQNPPKSIERNNKLNLLLKKNYIGIQLKKMPVKVFLSHVEKLPHKEHLQENS